MINIIKHIHCPVNGWDCPFYTSEPQEGCCAIYPENDPYEECDDFACVWDRDDDYVDDDES